MLVYKKVTLVQVTDAIDHKKKNLAQIVILPGTTIEGISDMPGSGW